jgi:hypothetical protein
MTSNIKYVLIGFICLFVVTLYGQNAVKQIPMGTTNLMVDSTMKKDTLWLKYIPVVPISYLKTDAWFIQAMHLNTSDTSFNILNDYQSYYAQKNNAFQLYFANNIKVKGAQIIYKVEQRYSLPDKDILFYLIIFIIL